MRDLFITCPHGFEGLLEQELRALGVSKVFPRFCGVLVPKDLPHVFLANYQSRIATRVLWPIATFPCSGKEDLYAQARKVHWSSFLHPRKTFAIDANVQHPSLKNSLFAALVVKDAICDFFRDKTGERPSINIQTPDVQLNLFIQKGTATLYLDTSGAPLHKRGWRTDSTEASIHESLAAALLLHAGYNGTQVLCDPFCGSGTFLIEAAWIATRTPPGSLRKQWGFFHLPGFEMAAWKTWKQSQDAKKVPLEKGKFFGADKSREAIDACKKNMAKAGVPEISVTYQEIAFFQPPIKPDLVVTNPPYGKRLETSELLIRQIEAFLENMLAPDGKAYLLSPEKLPFGAFEKKILSELPFKNGGLPVKLLSL